MESANRSKSLKLKILHPMYMETVQINHFNFKTYSKKLLRRTETFTINLFSSFKSRQETR